MARADRRRIKHREALIGAVAKVMRQEFGAGGGASLFRHESAFIASLRSDLCLARWPWATADRIARDLVAEALTKAGAERPTWAEGQRAYTQLHVERDACCRHCGLPLRSQHVNFCSSPCRSRWWALFNAEAA